MSENRDTILPDELVDLARRVIEANRAAGRRIAVAESCTGGLVAAALTEIAGSSDVFESGFVTYSNEAKMELLGVSSDVIETFGSVSIACAWAMAQGALARTRADVAVAITGIAGPAGGSALKPVGTVMFARAMAFGAVRHAKAQVGVAVTGVAGPTGGSKDKPVGTVVFALAEKGGTKADMVADKQEFGDLGRAGVRLQAALCALELLMPVQSP